MTYAQFLIYFLCIPIILLSFATWRDLRNHLRSPGWFRNVPGWLAVAIHVALAVLYTTPWDNYLVATGVWYYNPKLVTGITLGWVPIEEYTFFILQTILSGLWLLWLSRRMPLKPPAPKQTLRMRKIATVGVGIAWLLCLGGLISGWQPFIYLGLILVWALPPVALQMAFGADILWQYRHLIGLALGSVSVYLGLMDSLAIWTGTWTINPAQSLNIFLGGVLPVEEFIFFMMTNMLITFGITLLLSRKGRRRWTELKAGWAQLRRTRGMVEHRSTHQA